MPDNWGFVAAAYGLTAAVLLIYWRRLVRKERELRAVTTTRRRVAERASPVAERASSVGERSVAGTTTPVAERSQQPSRPGQPRREPDSKSSLS